MVVLDGVQIWRVHWASIFALQPRRQLSLRERRLLPSFSEHLAESLHSKFISAITGASSAKDYRKNSIKSYNL